MKIKKENKLLFIGDSITDCGRARPVGEGRTDDSYGRGYVNLVRGLLAQEFTELNIRVVNMGISGNTVVDLKERWQEDVIALKPDWLSIMIGINDVWRQFDRPLEKEIHVSLSEYKKTLDEIVSKTINKVSGMVIMSPFFIEPRREDPMRKMADEYSAVAKEVAKKYNAIFVDTQAEIDKLTQYIPTSSIAWDRVHPDVRGHMAIAKAFIRAIK